MITPPIPTDEAERLEDLRSFQILDTEKEAAFDRITLLSSKLFGMPISVVTLVDESRLWIKSSVGFDDPELPRSITFCGHTICQPEVMVVPDTAEDVRFHDNPLVTANPSLRFYAGAPLETSSGHRIGNLCVLDTKPRQFTDEQRQVLRDLSMLVMSELELRKAKRQIQLQLKLLSTTFDVLPDGIVLFNEEFTCVYANRALSEMFGLTPEEIVGWKPEDAAEHIKSLTADTDQAIFASEWRTPAQDMSAEQILVLTKPKYRVVRRTLHKIQIQGNPYLSLWSDITFEAEEIARQQRASMMDALTQLPNRRAVTLRLSQALAKGPTSVVLFDIDHFKRINDTFGHGVGDDVLKMVAQAIGGVTRDTDIVGRWGGEEFLGVLTGSLDGAVKFAERVRSAVSKLETPAGTVTISVGVAHGSASDVVDLADAKLYEAKHAGRNRVCS